MPGETPPGPEGAVCLAAVTQDAVPLETPELGTQILPQNLEGGNTTTSDAPTSPKTRIDVDLLHKRLAHISTNTILSGSDNACWRDTQAISRGSYHCDPCHLTIVHKARRSKNPVRQQLQPGACVSFDIVPNLCKLPLLKETNFSVFLFGVDLCTRRCDIVGMASKTSKQVIEAITLFEQRMGYNIREIHAILVMNSSL